MEQLLRFAEVDYSAVETARKVAKAAGCTFAVAAACVSANGGSFDRAVKAARKEVK